MKNTAIFVLATLGMGGAAIAAPGLRIDQAASIAQRELAARGYAPRIYVMSLGMEALSIAKPDQYWYARWSEAVPIDERKRELGLRINMDGSVIRMVEGSNASGSSAGREALRNHRTRSDRPSILDMKH